MRRVTSQYFGLNCVTLASGAKWCGVLDSASLDPISQITGGRRYAFNIDDAQLCLVRGCSNREDRHQYVTGSDTPGPNAFVSSDSTAAHRDAGPHHRWASGILWDRIVESGNDLNVQNRGNLGTGHGWAGGNCVVWNSQANGFVVQNPPTARNWLIGSIGTIKSGTVYVGPHDPGTCDAHGANVFPSTLWGNQRDDLLDAATVQVREYVAGDFDNFTADTGETTPVDAAWLATIQTAAGGAANVKGFDSLATNQWIAWTHSFALSAGDTVLSATLWISFRATSSVWDTDRIYFESTGASAPLTDFTSGIGTTGSTVVRVDLAGYLALLADGKLNLAVQDDTAIDWAVLELRVAPAPGVTTGTTTLAPEADAMVRGGASAGTNYGTGTVVTVKGDDSAAGDFLRRGLLRWDLGGVTGKVRHAKVRLVPVSAGLATIENGAAICAGNSWVESGVTWNNQPAAGKRFVSWNPVVNAPVEFNVTADVLAAQQADGRLSVQIFPVADVGGSGFVDYASKENATVANRPQLILTIESSNSAPTISNVADQSIGVNTATGAFAVIVGDVETPAASLSLAKTSSNTTLVPLANIVLGGSGANRTVTVTPAANQIGSATITVTVSDGALSASDSFNLEVTATATQLWRLQYFGIADNAGNAADLFDFDKDGLINLLEQALHANPTVAAAGVLPVCAIEGANLTLNYTRSKAALTEMAFAVEWAGAPGGAWSSSGVAENILSDNGAVQQVKASVALSGTKKFLHLRVTRP